MIKTRYTILAFDAEKAKGGSLCLVLKNSYSSTLITTGDSSLLGVGVASYLTSIAKFYITIDGEEYAFTSQGYAFGSTPSAYTLHLCSVVETLLPSGAMASGTIHRIVTRASNGSLSVSSDESNTLNVLISSLNARDQFALLILNGLLSKTDINPATLDLNTISYYCRLAYNWASSMMTAAANARGKFIDNLYAGSQNNDTPVEIDSLDNNIEKLISNFLLNEKLTTNKETITVGDSPNLTTEEVYSKRISAPTIESDIAQLAYNIDTLNTTLTTYLGNIATALSTISSNVASIQTNTLNTATGLSSLNTLNSEIKSSLLHTRGATTYTAGDLLYSVKSDVDTIQSDINDIKGDVANIETDVDSIDASTLSIDRSVNQGGEVLTKLREIKDAINGTPNS